MASLPAPLSDMMRVPLLRPQGVAWIIAAYRDLGSIEAVAATAGVHTRTLHRYIEANPEIGRALRKAGHVFGAGNVGRRVEAGKARALELLSGVKERSCDGIDGVAHALDVVPATIERWQRVYPETRSVVAGKLRARA